MRYADPYDVPGRWYKGNLHTHTTNSDGKLSPQEAVRRYDDLGHDFLALTDHNFFTDPAPLQAQTRMTLIPGFEWTIESLAHILCLGVRQVYTGTYQEVLSRTRSLGGTAMLCHPNWQREDYWPPEVMVDLHYYAGIEVFNSVITRLEGRALASDDWDVLLSAGSVAWGYANQDAHRVTDITPCCNVVLSPSGAAGDLLYNLEKGHCYASTGLGFAALGIRSGAIHVELEQDAGIRFIGPGGAVLAASAGRKARFVPSDQSYVRVEAEDTSGLRCWSQPFWRLE